MIRALIYWEKEFVLCHVCLINLGKSLCAPCVLSLITTNSVTPVLQGGKMLHSKPNNVDINSECIVGIMLTTVNT